MPSILRLNKQGLIDLIDKIEAGGGDATTLRRELEALGPDQDPRTRTRRRGTTVNSEEEMTTADHLNNRVGDLFTGGISDDLLALGLSIQLPSPSCTKGDSVPADSSSSAIFFNSFVFLSVSRICSDVILALC